MGSERVERTKSLEDEQYKSLNRNELQEKKTLRNLLKNKRSNIHVIRGSEERRRKVALQKPSKI